MTTQKRAGIEIVCAAVILAGGFLLGRAFPAHDYVQMSYRGLLLDKHTGVVCHPVKVVKGQSSAADDQKLVDTSPSPGAAATQPDVFETLRSQLQTPDYPECK